MTSNMSRVILEETLSSFESMKDPHKQQNESGDK